MLHNHCFPKEDRTLRKELCEEPEAASGTVRNSSAAGAVPSHTTFQLHQEPVIHQFILEYVVVYLPFSGSAPLASAKDKYIHSYSSNNLPHQDFQT